MADEKKKSLGYCYCLNPLYKDILMDVLQALDADISKHGQSTILPRQDKIAASDLASLQASIINTPACDFNFLRKKIEKEIEDEAGAKKAYNRLADVADMINEPTLANELRSIADDEAKHENTLRAIRHYQPGKMPRGKLTWQEGADRIEQLRAQKESRPFPKTYADWEKLAFELHSMGTLEDRDQITEAIAAIKRAQDQTRDTERWRAAEDAKRFLVDKSQEFGVI